MMIHIAYLVMGVLIGFLVKYETDTRKRKAKAKKREENRVTDNRDYDGMLESLKGINNNLSTIKKKEVR